MLNIKFIVMVADNTERISNAKLLKKQIPDLVIYSGDNDNVFNKYVNCFNISSEFDGVVVLEDDIQLCRNFLNRIIPIIENNSKDVISFFEKPNSKKQLFTSFRKGSEFLFNQCNYYPKQICAMMLDKNNLSEFKSTYFEKYKVWVAPIDIYIGFVLDKYKIKYLMQVPFLVQHLPFKSMLGNRSSKRQTKYFIDDL